MVRRRWLTREAFLDQLGATNLIPGPSSTQMAMGIGWRRAAGRASCVGGCCFILPGGPAHPGPGLGLRALRPAAPGPGHPVRHQAGGPGGGGPGPVEPGPHRLPHPDPAAPGLLALVAATLGLHPLAVLLGAGVAGRGPGPGPGGRRRRRGAALPLALGGALGPAAAPAVGLASAVPVLPEAGVPCCSAAATCCWPSSRPTWWTAALADPGAAPGRGGRRPGHPGAGCSPRRPSSATC